MEIKHYLTIIQRWAWLLILGLLVFSAGGYLYSLYLEPVYQATTKVLVTRAPQSGTTDLSYLSDQQLTQTYVQLVTMRSVLSLAADRLGFGVDSSQIRAQSITGTQIIQISAEDNDPQRAALIANTLVTVLIEQNEKLQAGRYESMEQSLQAQKTQIEAQISNLQSQIDQASVQTVEEQRKWIEEQIYALQTESTILQQEIARLTPPAPATPTPDIQSSLDEKKARLAQIQPVLALYQQSYTNLIVYGQPVEGSGNQDSRLSLLRTTQSLYQQIYLSILSNLESVRLARLQNTPNVVQIEPAIPNSKPVRPRPMSNTLIAGTIGLLLAAGIAFLIEYLDDTLKTPEDIERLLDLSTIGYIAQMKYADESKEELYVARQPRSPVSEAFRSLRTNLEFAGVDKPIRSIMVTSAGPGEGKTTISANLAAIIAQGGKRVILMDADLRRPCIHRMLGIPNRVGLSDVFRGHLDLQTAIHSWDGVEGMKVITSGSLPPNPAELLGSAKMIQILEELKQLADVVVIDCPPSLVADAQVLAAKVDAVLLVVQPGHTHIDSAKATLEQLGRANARVVGAVLNRIPRERGYYYGGYRYHYYRGDQYQYYGDSSDGGRKKKRRSVS